MKSVKDILILLLYYNKYQCKVSGHKDVSAHTGVHLFLSNFNQLLLLNMVINSDVL